jgi:hypothetical protein
MSYFFVLGADIGWSIWPTEPVSRVLRPNRDPLPSEMRNIVLLGEIKPFLELGLAACLMAGGALLAGFLAGAGIGG